MTKFERQVAENGVLRAEIKRLEEMIKKICRAQKLYEMNPCWSERQTLKMTIHETAQKVYPGMKWVQALKEKT